MRWANAPPKKCAFHLLMLCKDEGTFFTPSMNTARHLSHASVRAVFFWDLNYYPPPPPPWQFPTPCNPPPPPPGDRHFHAFLVNIYCVGLCCPYVLYMALY